MANTIGRGAYAAMFGPTTGDRIRLADTELVIEIESDRTIYGEEVKFGGGKVIRDGMGQSQVTRAGGAVDTIITNAVNIAAELAGATVEVILTGGTLRKNSFSLVGPIAEETLRRLSADILFLGVDGFDVHFGLSTPNLLEAKVNRVMVEVAKKTVGVCDSSKFGRRSLSLISPTSTLNEVITDRGAPKSDLRILKRAGIEVTLV